MDPADGGPSRELRLARAMSRSRGGKSRWSRLSLESLESLTGERLGGDGRLSLRSRSKSRSRSLSEARQELCGGCG